MSYKKKNTKKIQNKLHDLGYSLCSCCDFEYAVWLDTSIDDEKGHGSVHGVGYSGDSDTGDTVEDRLNFYLSENEKSKGKNKFIDCGENEDLFFAIAALRDDIDKNQWFVMDIEEYINLPQDTWFKSTGIEGGKHVEINIDSWFCHKATIGELIEHFKIK